MAALGFFLGRSGALLSSSSGSLGCSWGAFDHFSRPKLALLGSQDAFGSDDEAKIRMYKKYWKTIRKTHIFDPKMAPKSRMMTPKSFQEPSWPLLDRSGGILGRSRRILGRSWGLLGRSGADLGHLRTILGRSWGLFGPILGVLGRSWGDLRASWGAQGPQDHSNSTPRGAVRARRRWLPVTC